MITTHGLTKRFGSRLVVDSVDLDVRAGDIYGFLGANGSGKTTTVRILLGLVLATSGEARLFDQLMPKASARVLPRVGTLVETPAAYNHLSGRTNLALLDATGPSGDRRSRDARITETLSRVGLADIDRRPAHGVTERPQALGFPRDAAGVHIEQRDACPALSQRLGDGEPEAAARARDDRALPCDVE